MEAVIAKLWGVEVVGQIYIYVWLEEHKKVV